MLTADDVRRVVDGGLVPRWVLYEMFACYERPGDNTVQDIRCEQSYGIIPAPLFRELAKAAGCEVPQ